LELFEKKKETGKDGMMDEETKIKNLIEAGKETRFTSENQPPPENKGTAYSAAIRYKKMREAFFEELAGMKLKDGSKINFWEKGASMIHAAIFGDKSKLSEKDKLHFFKEMLKELPRDDKLTIDPSIVGNVYFYLPEKDKEEKLSCNVEKEAKTDSEINNDNFPSQDIILGTSEKS
jgi:hypothetical protein